MAWSPSRSNRPRTPRALPQAQVGAEAGDGVIAVPRATVQDRDGEREAHQRLHKEVLRTEGLLETRNSRPRAIPGGDEKGSGHKLACVKPPLSHPEHVTSRFLVAGVGHRPKVVGGKGGQGFHGPCSRRDLSLTKNTYSIPINTLRPSLRGHWLPGVATRAPVG